MKMFGIRFKIPNAHDSFLYKIFTGVDFKNYLWYIQQAEVYDKFDFLFDNDIYTTEDFMTKAKEIYYVVSFFAKVNNQMLDKSIEVDDYKSFIESDCFLSVCIKDCIFVDIYCKDEEVLSKIINNVNENNFSELEILDVEENINK